MKQFEVGCVHFLTTALTFSEIVHLCHSAVPISNVLSTILTQYMDTLSLSKRTDSHSAAGAKSGFVKYADNGVVESREPPIYMGGGFMGGGGGGGKGWGSGGGGGYDGGGNGHGAITLDPVSIISLLALGAFLINNILQLLRANAAPAPAPAPAVPPGRSLNLDINVPMDIRDFGSIMGKMDYRRSNGKRSMSDNNGEPSFSQFFENVGSLYYLHPKKRNICIKKVVCGYVNAQQSRESHQGTLKTRIFDLMLSTITKFVAPEIGENAKQELCHEFNKLCSDTILHDAKVSTENKVYGHVTTFISNFAMSNFMAG